jgi:hypothetical protein
VVISASVDVEQVPVAETPPEVEEPAEDAPEPEPPETEAPAEDGFDDLRKGLLG